MKKIIKLTVGLLLAALFFAGCDTGDDSVEASQPVTPSEKTLVGIQITKKPKIEYFIDEPLTLEGIEVSAIYSDNTSEKVRIGVSNVSGFDSSAPGTLTLTVTYKNKTTTFNVTVDNVTLSKIEIINVPVKNEYWMYEELDLAGLKVKATLSNGNTEIIETDELETSGFNSAATGKQNITVNIRNIKNKTAIFTVNVTAKTFTITFDKNGGDTEANPKTKTVIQPAPGVDSLPAQPTKAGYNFTGWNTKADGSGGVFTADSLVTSNFTVYAQWFKPTLTFNSNGGSAVVSQDVNYDTTAIKPADPVKSGYNSKFGGWYTDDTTFASQWNFTTAVKTDITLYAKWVSYELGDTGPGGGKIFYRSETGFTVQELGIRYYFEISLNDLGEVQWGAYGNSDIGTGTAIGDGKKNTRLIIAELGSETGKAAQACVNYANNGFKDWFLPSKDELYQIFDKRNYIGNIDINSYWYWSSTENYNNSYQSTYYRYSSGIKDGNTSRNDTCHVRAIRAF